MHGEDSRPDGALTSAPGTVAEVVYAGPVTRYVVDLDAGARLTAVDQNSRDAAHGGTVERGSRVHLAWRPESVIEIP